MLLSAVLLLSKRIIVGTNAYLFDIETKHSEEIPIFTILLVKSIRLNFEEIYLSKNNFLINSQILDIK